MSVTEISLRILLTDINVPKDKLVDSYWNYFFCFEKGKLSYNEAFERMYDAAMSHIVNKLDRTCG